MNFLVIRSWFEFSSVKILGRSFLETLTIFKFNSFRNSINISNNLKEYLKITPCGLDNTKITSIYSEKKLIPKNYEKKIINLLVKNINKL